MPAELPAELPVYLGEPRVSRMLKQLLPRGLFALEQDSYLARLLDAVSFEFARVEARGSYLLAESDPRTATETLEEWERLLGLPDDVVTSIPATVELRRLAVTQKLLRQGGQHRQFYVALAAACGYTATVEEPYFGLVLRAGFNAGASCYADYWAHAWHMSVQPPTGAALSHAVLEAVIRRAAPAHTVVFFNYL